MLLLSRFTCVRLCDPIDGSPLGSPIPEILQARILEWVAISFASAWKWKVKVKSLSRVRLHATPWTVAQQAPPSMGFFQPRVLEWGAIAFSLRLKSSPTSQKGSLFHFIWHPLFWMIPVLWLSFFEILFSFISWAAQDLSSDMWT